MDDKGRQSLPSAAGEGAGARHPSDWVQGNSAAVSWQAVEGATEYNIYREEAGYFGFIGISQSTTFSDQNYQADTADTPREDWNPFAENNNPGVVAFHQQRMVLAATPAAPQAFYMSRTGDFENFRKSRPLQDDDPVEYLIASGSIDAITWAASFGDLLLGTSGSEYKAGGGGDGAAITPNSVSITAQSYWGSAGLAPIIIGNSILHVQRHGGRVRDLFYSLEKDGYAGNDLSILAPHLFEGHSLKQWAYQQTPGSTIWIARDDGLLLAFTYMKEHDIWGWSRQITDGRVRSVTALSGRDSDVLLLVVERRIQGETRFFLERLGGQWRDDAPVSEAFFVDCGLTIRRENPSTLVEGLDHLEGRELSVLADGSPVEGCVARNGRIELPLSGQSGPGRAGFCLGPLAPAAGKRHPVRLHPGPQPLPRALHPAPAPQRGRQIRPQPRRTLRSALSARTLGRGRGPFFRRRGLHPRRRPGQFGHDLAGAGQAPALPAGGPGAGCGFRRKMTEVRHAPFSGRNLHPGA